MSSQPVVNIVTWDNQGGLSTDLEVLSDTLLRLGCRVRYRGRRARRPTGVFERAFNRVSRVVSHSWARFSRRSLYDANLFLEIVDPVFVPHGQINCLVPNPEFMRGETRAWVASMNWVLCKVPSALDALKELGVPAQYVGFTSPDRYDPSVSRNLPLRCLHLAGKSEMKGTAAVIDVWRRHPEWPQLYVLQQEQRYGHSVVEKRAPAPNIELITERLPDQILRRYQNECAIHVAPSEAEGFGHVIVEGMSCAAVVVSTDAPPMNELIAPGRGVLVKALGHQSMALGRRYFVDLDDLECKIDGVLKMAPHERAAIGACAREWFLENDKSFRTALRNFFASSFGASS